MKDARRPMEVTLFTAWGMLKEVTGFSDSPSGEEGVGLTFFEESARGERLLFDTFY